MPIDIAKLHAASLHTAAMTLPARYDDLTPAQRMQIRTRYIWEQHGLCAHCAAMLDGPPSEEVASLPIDVTVFPDNFFEHPVHLHHDHVTGLTVGAVHAHCNAVLWQYEGQ